MKYSIPLFPLNVVLFPGLPLQLHIFEPRYRQMIRKCLDHSSPFGVVYIRSGQEVLGPNAEPYAVGCAAHIVQHEPLADGRCNIIVIGRERFRIHNLDLHSQPYMVAEVETMTLQNLDHPAFRHHNRHLRPWVAAYLKLLGEANDAEVDIAGLPTEPLALSYFAAHLLQVPLEDRQQLLEIDQAQTLAVTLRAYYRKETALFRAIIRRDADMVPSSSLN